MLRFGDMGPYINLEQVVCDTFKGSQNDDC